MRIAASNTNLYNYRNNKQNQTSPAFTSLTDNRAFNAISDYTAKKCGKLVSTKFMENLITKTNGKKAKSPEKLMAHLMVFGSTLLSAFYVGKTLSNKDMDERNKKTLAINQGLVYLVSTVMAYTFDSWLNKKITALTDKFKEVNKETDIAKLRKLYPHKFKTHTDEMIKAEYPKMVDKWATGIKMAKVIMVIDTVYRFIAPVIVTPFANAIGNRIHENADKKKALNA